MLVGKPLERPRCGSEDNVIGYIINIIGLMYVSPNTFGSEIM
jgi:hypothetical protein